VSPSRADILWSGRSRRADILWSGRSRRADILWSGRSRRADILWSGRSRRERGELRVLSRELNGGVLVRGLHSKVTS